MLTGRFAWYEPLLMMIQDVLMEKGLLSVVGWWVVDDVVEWMEKGKSEKWEDGLFVVQKTLTSDLVVIALVGGCAFRLANPATFGARNFKALADQSATSI